MKIMNKTEKQIIMDYTVQDNFEFTTLKEIIIQLLQNTGYLVDLNTTLLGYYRLFLVGGFCELVLFSKVFLNANTSCILTCVWLNFGL